MGGGKKGGKVGFQKIKKDRKKKAKTKTAPWVGFKEHEAREAEVRKKRRKGRRPIRRKGEKA